MCCFGLRADCGEVKSRKGWKGGVLWRSGLVSALATELQLRRLPVKGGGVGDAALPATALLRLAPFSREGGR